MKPSRYSGSFLKLVFICACLAVHTSNASEFSFNDETQVIAGEQSYQLNASIQYELNETTLEALDNGIPLTFELHVQIRRKGAWIWESDVIDTRFRSQLRYHPLSSLYEVYDLASKQKKVFATRDAAIQELGRLDEIPLVDKESLEPETVYRVTLETRLDVEALPLPLRPKAHISPEWHLSSNTWEWLLEP